MPTPVPTIAAEDLPVPHWLALDIVDLVEQVTVDKSRVVITGGLVNRGNRGTRRVKVHVEGLDAAGRTVVAVDAMPDTDRLAPSGGRARFIAELPNDPSVERYHVEAVAE